MFASLSILLPSTYEPMMPSSPHKICQNCGPVSLLSHQMLSLPWMYFSGDPPYLCVQFLAFYKLLVIHLTFFKCNSWGNYISWRVKYGNDFLLKQLLWMTDHGSKHQANIMDLNYYWVTIYSNIFLITINVMYFQMAKLCAVVSGWQ